jgi:hypothetical protein
MCREIEFKNLKRRYNFGHLINGVKAIIFETVMCIHVA